MRRYVLASCAAIGCFAMSLPTLAAEDEARFEVTPFAAYRGGGEFSDTDSDSKVELPESNAWGLTVNGSVSPYTEWEVLWSRQLTDVDASDSVGPQTSFPMRVDYLHFGGTYLLEGEKVRPFIALTIGATRFDPGLPGLSGKTYGSMSFGAGWKFYFGEHVGLRLEARGFGTLIDSSSRLFCESDGGGACLIVAKGEVLTQFEARAGFSIRF